MKIRGNTVGTPMRPEKFLVKARNLNEEEKAQARANIGAAAEGDSPGGSGVSALIVTMSEDSIASHTPAQILAHMQNGGVVYLNPYGYEGTLVPCTECTEYLASFTVLFDDYTGYTHTIYEDGTVNQNEQRYLIPEDIPTAFPNPHALTFTGAVSATYDGSKAVSIEIPSGGGSGGASGWTHIDTIDLSSGALSYEFDTTGYNELMLVNKTAVNCAGSVVNWKGASSPLTGGNLAVNKVIGTVFMLHYLGNGTIAYSNGRQSDTIYMGGAMNVNEATLNNTLRLTFTTATSGTIFIAGRA